MKAGFPSAARTALADSQLRRNLGHATSTIRAKRAAVVAEVPDWEALRDAGAEIKERALRHLDVHLEGLEAAVQRAGGTVHWARDGAEACTIVAGIARDQRSVTRQEHQGVRQPSRRPPRRAFYSRWLQSMIEWQTPV